MWEVSICRFCRKQFIPVRNHPQQMSCGSPECKRKADAERAARHRAKLVASSAGRKKLSEKNYADYITKKARQFDSGNEIHPVKIRNPPLTLQLVYEEFILIKLCLKGMCILLNRLLNTDAFSFGKCVEIGKAHYRGENVEPP